MMPFPPGEHDKRFYHHSNCWARYMRIRSIFLFFFRTKTLTSGFFDLSLYSELVQPPRNNTNNAFTVPYYPRSPAQDVPPSPSRPKDIHHLSVPLNAGPKLARWRSTFLLLPPPFLSWRFLIKKGCILPSLDISRKFKSQAGNPTFPTNASYQLSSSPAPISIAGILFPECRASLPMKK